jgi:hypothetical protein
MPPASGVGCGEAGAVGDETMLDNSSCDLNGVIGFRVLDGTAGVAEDEGTSVSDGVLEYEVDAVLGFRVLERIFPIAGPEGVVAHISLLEFRILASDDEYEVPPRMAEQFRTRDTRKTILKIPTANSGSQHGGRRYLAVRDLESRSRTTSTNARTSTRL